MPVTVFMGDERCKRPRGNGVTRGKGIAAIKKLPLFPGGIGAKSPADRLQDLHHDEAIEQRLGAQHAHLARLGIVAQHAVSVEARDQRYERIGCADLRNMLAPRDLARAVLEDVNGAVIGGGLLGLEAAKAMLDLGIANTQVIEFAPRLMPRQIDDAASKILQLKLELLGLTIHTGKNTIEITGEDRIHGLKFSDGTSIDTDMLVISAGIKPRDELARSCGLETGQRGGIVVNDNMQTSDNSIYAIGECALYKGMIYGLVAPGYEMADVAITNITGGQKIFTGYDMSTKLKLIGVDVASFGDPFVQSAECQHLRA